MCPKNGKNAYLYDILNYCKGSASSNHTRLCTNIDISSLHPTKKSPSSLDMIWATFTIGVKSGGDVKSDAELPIHCNS